MTLCINTRCQKPENSGTTLFCSSCGSELLLEGRYRVNRLLGEGGFGKTYEVTDRGTTVKVLKILINNHPKHIELFQREAQVLSSLNNPGIPKVEPDAYFTFSARNSTELLHCLVMEFIDGQNLFDYLQHRGSPINEKLAIAWLTELATILREVHSQNLFHRDIKPPNIMLKGSDGRLVLIDFGTARAVTGTYMAKQAIGQVTGIVSAGYTPVEQMNNQAVQQSDFFALGRTFVYLLTGKDPSEFYHANTDEFLWRDAIPAISPEFADLLDDMMARLSSQRPQTAEVILQRLDEIKSAQSPRQVPPTQPPVTPPNGYDPTVVASQVNSTPTLPVTNPVSPTLPSPPLPRGQQGQQSTSPQPVPPPFPSPHPQKTSAHSYAGFWLRLQAYIIDVIVLTVGLALVWYIISLLFNFKYDKPLEFLFLSLLPMTVAGTVGGVLVECGLLGVFVLYPEGIINRHYSVLITMNIFMGLASIILSWVYFTKFEASPQKATIGKIALGIGVNDLKGNRISFNQAEVRYWSKNISGLIIMIGFLMAGFTKKKQALHDMIAGTLVVKR